MEISNILYPPSNSRDNIWICPQCETENSLTEKMCIICGWQRSLSAATATGKTNRDEDGRCTQVPQFSYMVRHINSHQFIYGTNDADGKWIEEYAPNGYLNYKWWKSSGGRRERQICYDTDGTIACFIKYDTTEYPHRERTTWYDSDGDMIRSVETTFDAFGNVTDEQFEV